MFKKKKKDFEFSFSEKTVAEKILTIDLKM